MGLAHAKLMRFHRFPTVCLQRFLNAAPGPKRISEAQHIVHAARELGFLHVENTPLTPAVIERALRAVRWLMQSPPAQKQRCSVLPAPNAGFGSAIASMGAREGGRGYYRYVGAAQQGDNIEAFQIGNDSTSVAALRRPYYEEIGMPEDIWLAEASQCNRWPPTEASDAMETSCAGRSGGDALRDSGCDAAEFREAILAYWQAAEACTTHMLEVVELGLGLTPHCLRQAHTRADHTFEAKRYPQLRASTDDGHGLLRVAPHADQSTLTLLTQDTEGGLEVLSGVGGASSASNASSPGESRTQEEWLRVPAQERAILVNVGNFLERWTCGALPSTLHRVVGNGSADKPDHERISLVFFAQPNWDASMHPLIAVEAPCGRDDDNMAGDLMPF